MAPPRDLGGGDHGQGPAHDGGSCGREPGRFGCDACAGGDAECLPERLPYTTIQQALAAVASGDTISVAPGTYPGGFTIGKNVTVVGSGAAQTTVKGTGHAGVGITVASGVTTAIEALTVDAVSGDAVSNDGTLTVRGAVITGAGSNAALFNSGTLTVNHSQVSGNQTSGIFASYGGPVTIYGSTITQNFGIAGVVNNGVPMTIANSTISGNAGDTAGGIYNIGGTLTIRASTISGNNSGGIANGVSGTTGPTSTLRLYGVTVKNNFGGPVGGIWNGTLGVAALHYSRVVRNTGFSYGGIYNQHRLTIDDSVVSHNTPNNCLGC